MDQGLFNGITMFNLVWISFLVILNSSDEMGRNKDCIINLRIYLLGVVGRVYSANWERPSAKLSQMTGFQVSTQYLAVKSFA